MALDQEHLGSASHLVQFYDDDGALYGTLTRFVGAGLAGGESVILIATADHVRVVRERLGVGGFDLERLDATGRLVTADAGETLDRILVDGAPAQARFSDVVRALVGRARAASGGSGQVRAFSEMVDLLCRRGEPGVALQLERRWDAFVAEHPMTLLCGYVRDDLGPQDVQRVSGDAEHVRLGLGASAHDLRLKLAKEHDQAIEHAERAVRSERQRLHDLCMVMPAAIWILRGRDHHIEFVNPVARALFPGRELVGRTLREAVPDADPKRLELLNQVFETGAPWRGQELSTTLDWNGDDHATERFLDIAYEPFRDASGAVEGVTIFSFDVTQRVLARRKTDAIVRELENANRMKDDFLATLSHELRTPLNAILGWARMLRGDHLSADKRERAVETIERNALAQAQLIDDLLDVSRIVSGKLRLEVTSVDLAQLVASAAASLAPAAQAKGVTIDLAVDPDAGAAMGDADRLQQVAWNLLSNAIKFTPKGGRVEVRARRLDSSVELSVADDGDGIDPAFLPYVFDRFSQADPTKSRKHMGLGLGLAIVRHVVELHGGRVSVESEGRGRGATFRVVLPIAPFRSASLGRAQGTRSTGVTRRFEPPPELVGIHALIVEDEHDARELMAHVLAPCRMRISTAASVAEALEIIDRDPPSVIVSDIGMPGEDGYAFIQKLRARPPEGGGRIPAVALTAYTRAEDRTRALLAGFHMHVPKPVEPAELVAVLASLSSLF